MTIFQVPPIYTIFKVSFFLNFLTHNDVRIGAIEPTFVEVAQKLLNTEGQERYISQL